MCVGNGMFGNVSFSEIPVLDLMSLLWSRLRATGANTFRKLTFLECKVQIHPNLSKWALRGPGYVLQV